MRERVLSRRWEQGEAPGVEPARRMTTNQAPRRLARFYEHEHGHEWVAVDHAVTLLDRCPSDRLGEMALAAAGRPEEQHVFALGDEARGCELVDQSPVHLLVEIKVEGVERAVGVAEARGFDATTRESVLTPQQLVGDERCDEVDWREPLGLRVTQSGFEDVGHSRQS